MTSGPDGTETLEGAGGDGTEATATGSPPSIADTDADLDSDPDLEAATDRTTADLLADLRRLLREGRTRTDELADSLELSAVDTERLVRAAERLGDVTRAGYTGSDLYTIRLTDDGAAKLPGPTDREARLAEYNLADRDVDVLRAVDAAGRCTASTVRERLDEPRSPMELIPILTHLVREGYLEESGLLRRYVEVSTDGRSVLEALEGEP